MTDDTRLPAIDKELVDEFVLRAHGDFDFVQRTVEQAPQIVNGARDGAEATGNGTRKHAEVGGEEAREVLALLTHEPAGV